MKKELIEWVKTIESNQSLLNFEESLSEMHKHNLLIRK